MSKRTASQTLVRGFFKAPLKAPERHLKHLQVASLMMASKASEADEFENHLNFSWVPP